MATPDFEVLTRLVSQLVARASITHDERREILHIARGLSTSKAAEIERVTVAMIRTRRKALYRKLGLAGSSQLLSNLLALALAMLAGSDAGGRRGLPR